MTIRYWTDDCAIEGCPVDALIGKHPVHEPTVEVCEDPECIGIGRHHHPRTAQDVEDSIESYRVARERAWREGYEACYEGRQKHNPYRREHYAD